MLSGFLFLCAFLRASGINVSGVSGLRFWGDVGDAEVSCLHPWGSAGNTEVSHLPFWGGVVYFSKQQRKLNAAIRI